MTLDKILQLMTDLNLWPYFWVAVTGLVSFGLDKLAERFPNFAEFLSGIGLDIPRVKRGLVGMLGSLAVMLSKGKLPPPPKDGAQ